MAAIVPTSLAVVNKNGASDGSGAEAAGQAARGRYVKVRTGTAQANTGQTDWFWVPNWAKVMMVYLNVTATSGTTPSILPQVVVTDPVILDTKSAATGGGGTGTGNVGQSSLTGGITSTGNVCITVCPGETGIADKIAVGASGGTVISINSVLPSVLGITLTMDRADGDETYTYTLGVEFYGAEKLLGSSRHGA